MATEAKEVDNESQISESKDVASLEIDNKKVDTAVKFLLNPKVRNTPFEKRISFLRNKGLNEKEINIAVERSGAKEDKNIPNESASSRIYNNADNKTSVVQVPPPLPPQRSFLNSLSAVVVGGGLVYAVGYIVQNYLIPYFHGRGKNDSEQLIESIKDLSEGINQLSSEMAKTMKNLEDQLQEQRNLLSVVNSDLAVTKARLDLFPSETTSLSDVKTELASVKGLLLGRRQFPQSPFVAPSQSPSIPAWQKAARKIEGSDDGTNAVDKDAEKADRSEGAGRTMQNDVITNESFNSDGNFAFGYPYDIPPNDSERIVDLNDSDDREVEGITENDSNTLSSTYVKLDDGL